LLSSQGSAQIQPGYGIQITKIWNPTIGDSITVLSTKEPDNRDSVIIGGSKYQLPLVIVNGSCISVTAKTGVDSWINYDSAYIASEAVVLFPGDTFAIPARWVYKTRFRNTPDT